MSQTTSIGKTRPIINTGKRTICYLYRYCILSKNIHRFSILLSIKKGIPLQCDLIVFDFSFRKSIIKLKCTRMWHWVFWWNIHIIFLFCWLKKQSLTFIGVNTKSIWYLCFCDNRNVEPQTTKGQLTTLESDTRPIGLTTHLKSSSNQYTCLHTLWL